MSALPESFQAKVFARIGADPEPPVRGNIVSREPAPVLGTGSDEMRTFYIETFGCQMNDYDSEFIATRFLEEGYLPAASAEVADVLIFNTCAVRDGAESRVRRRVMNLSTLKRERPGFTIGVVGCMAQRLGEDIAFPRGLVDLVAGTDTYRDLPRLIEESRGRQRRAPLVHTSQESLSTYTLPDKITPLAGPVAPLTIMQGCDKFCTFCIVPMTRGRERSKPWGEVIREAQNLVQRGAKEIQLLGQNVNSYRDGDVGFADLLRRVDDIPGVERIHFTSSYPRDMTEDVFRAVAEGRAPVRFLHFPVQSGSDRVLRRMKRRHTVDWYLRQIDLARTWIPDVQFATDLIVGFPGETDEDFQGTLDLVRRVRFAECYTYNYSPREGTPASKLVDDLPDEVKAERLGQLIEVQRKIGREILAAEVGKRERVLVEGPSKRDSSEVFGRTRHRFMVVLPQDGVKPGDLVDVDLVELRGTTLRGISRRK